MGAISHIEVLNMFKMSKGKRPTDREFVEIQRELMRDPTSKFSREIVAPPWREFGDERRFAGRGRMVRQERRTDPELPRGE